MVEDTTITFTSGDRPTTIPQENVAYTTPETDQRFFIEDWECKTSAKTFAYARIRLEQNQTYLFDPIEHKKTAPGAITVISADLYEVMPNGQRTLVLGGGYIASYDAHERSVNLTGTPRALKPSTRYQIELIRADAYGGKTGTVSESINKATQSKESDTITRRSLSGTTTRKYVQKMVLASFSFGTSRYENYQAKLKDCKLEVVEETQYRTE